MKILTKVLALALILTMALSLAACGGETPTPTQAPTQAPEVKPTAPVMPEETSAPASDKIVYKVTVVDEAGNPIEGAFVQLCLESCTPRVTDANGVATYEMDVEADYKISFVTVPAGYAAEEAYYFPDGSFETTITLKAA